ncbi:phosphohistidine phosphatase SixA [Aquabacterium sp. OR-4]|uniref:phosphohistidine phosphatase SixA n=1 Tax=Aquabacterium sp. OR-4 TaxID=2978127 RepID=UPI0021B3AFFC|nr:phosphohistidine phosphatase SixA [Aquabacterium sp. OR-4]MDT7836376.1 phosphohistidine phosphatase SixA [Aquabacterium sp. OR-4]
MDLILWRHAEARDAREGEDDLARPLTPRGEKQAQRMADWLNRFLPETTRVIVSPALRTRQTAEALGRKCRVIESLGPGGSADQLLAAARWPDSREPVLVIGHQPTLGQTAAWLMAGAAALEAPVWSVRKGGVWWLRHRERDEGAEVVLVAVRTPDKL